MACTRLSQKREAQSAMGNINPSHALKQETAVNEFLRATLRMTVRELMETAAELGDEQRAHKHNRRKAHEKKKFDSRTINTLKGKLLAEQDTNRSLQKAAFGEQNARKSEANKASDKMKAAKSYIEHLHDDLKAEKQRAKEAERACLEKEIVINDAKLKQQYSDYRLIAARGKLSEATGCIELLREELKSQQGQLEAAESKVKMLTDKLETAEKNVHPLQVEQDMLKAQVSENEKRLRTEFAAEFRDIRAQIANNSATGKKCTELEQDLATEQKARVIAVNAMEALRQAEKVARDEAQRKGQELEAKIREIKFAEKAQRDNLSKQAVSKTQNLQEELTKAKEQQKKSQDQHNSDLKALAAPQSELMTAESRNQDLEDELKTAKDKSSGFEEKYSKAAADALSSQRVLAAAEQETQTQKDKFQALNDEMTAAEERCAGLELDIKQQQDANSQLVVDHNEHLNRNTENADKLQKQTEDLQEQLESAHEQLKIKDAADASRAMVDQTKLTEQSHNNHQDQVDKAEFQTKLAKFELQACRRELELAVHNHEYVVKLTDEEQDGRVQEWAVYVQDAMEVMKGHEEECEKRCKDAMDLMKSHQEECEKRCKAAEDRQANPAAAESLEVQESNNKGGQGAEESNEDEQLEYAESDASDRFKRHDSGIDDDSSSASDQSTSIRLGRGRGARNAVKELHAKLDDAQERSTQAMDVVAFVRSQIHAAREATRPTPPQTRRSVDSTEKQPDTATVSRSQDAEPVQPPQQQAHGQNVRQDQESHPAEAIQPLQQQSPAQSLQSTEPSTTANSPQPAPATVQLAQQRSHGLIGSKWEHEPDLPLQPPQQQSNIPKGPKRQPRRQFWR